MLPPRCVRILRVALESTSKIKAQKKVALSARIASSVGRAAWLRSLKAVVRVPLTVDTCSSKHVSAHAH